MLLLLSPAKTLDYDSPLTTRRFSQPDYLPQSQQLIERLRHFSPAALAELMSLSDKLAQLNVGRYADWHTPFTPDNARPAVLAFMGDVYEGLQARQFDDADLDYAQQHLRILSGLYGLLRPLDLIQPYRLEMGTRLDSAAGRDLYAFWGQQLAQALDQLAQAAAQGPIINLASDEYFKAVPVAALRTPVIQPVFQDRKNGVYKIISFHAKRARGMMARFAIRHRLQHAEALQGFDEAGYRFAPEASSEDRWLFRREAP